MIKVSVIMPVYNSEKYLAEAIESVLNQSLSNIELICVDDGSKDNSGKICDEYARKDNRILVIHQKNKGICAARNAGIKKAKGEYIGFCDNDDKCLPNMLEDNYKLAKKNDADVVRFQRLRIRINEKGGRTSEKLKSFPACVLREDEIWKRYGMVMAAGQGVWNGLYRRKMIIENRLKFDENMKYGFEDKMFNHIVYEVCGCVVLNPKIYYQWIQRYNHSTSRKFSINHITAGIRCYRKELQLCEQHGIKDKMKSELRKSLCYQMKEYACDVLIR